MPFAPLSFQTVFAGFDEQLAVFTMHPGDPLGKVNGSAFHLRCHVHCCFASLPENAQFVLPSKVNVTAIAVPFENLGDQKQDCEIDTARGQALTTIFVPGGMRNAEDRQVQLLSLRLGNRLLALIHE